MERHWAGKGPIKEAPLCQKGVALCPARPESCEGPARAVSGDGAQTQPAWLLVGPQCSGAFSLPVGGGYLDSVLYSVFIENLVGCTPSAPRAPPRPQFLTIPV